MCLKQDYTETIFINDFFQLQDIIQGRDDFPDFRDKYIFRGVSKISHELIPSSLRGNNIIDCIKSDYAAKIHVSKGDVIRYGLDLPDEGPDDEGFFEFSINKYDEFENGVKLDDLEGLNQLKLVKEIDVLLNFITSSDIVGLKVSIPQKIRKEQLYSGIDLPSKWPHADYYEIISLAQHYGLPTRALDWSYDFKVALYFAVRNVLNDDFLIEDSCNDGVLWAFNHSYFKGSTVDSENSFKIQFYRPEYFTNPNLKAQKGLFTFVIDSELQHDERALNEIIIDELNKNKLKRNDKIIYDITGLKKFKLSENEKIFYKFIIPKEIKSEILNQLYIEEYSEEYLFPGYYGVAKSIKNKAKLDDIRNSF